MTNLLEFSRQEYWGAQPSPWVGPGKPMTSLDSVLKNRDITVPTKVRIVKAMFFPVAMYESYDQPR